MALQITGKIEFLGATTKVATKSNDTFQRRELVLMVARYDQYTGEIESENHPQFIFNGQKNCEKLDAFKVGDVVTVDFIVDGVWYEKDGERRNYTKVVGYNVQPYKSKKQDKPVEAVSDNDAGQPVQPTPQIDKLPWEV